MTRSQAKSFRAVLEPLRSGLGWIIAPIPFNVATAWPERRGLRVRGEIEGFAFRTSLFPNQGGDGHFLLVNKKMQTAARAAVGSQVRITLEPDLEERVAQVPAELALALKGDRRLRKYFEALNYSTRKAIGDWVSEPKGAAARQKRAEMMAERLLLTLEGETELPPILRAAFDRHPFALAGWNAMTPLKRRSFLLAIYYYQTAESRQRRAAKVAEEAQLVARKQTRRREELGE